jgi:hypothetical protein
LLLHSQIQLVLLLRVLDLGHPEGAFDQRNSRTLASEKLLDREQLDLRDLAGRPLVEPRPGGLDSLDPIDS